MIDEPTGITRAAGLRHPVTALEVDPENGPELLGSLPGRGDRGTHPRVVDQDVDPTERLDRPIDQSPAILRTTHVGPHGQRTPPSGFDQSAGLGKPVDATGTERDIGAGLGERQRSGHAQPRRRSGHHGNLAVEPKQVEHRHRSTARRVASPTRDRVYTAHRGRQTGQGWSGNRSSTMASRSNTYFVFRVPGSDWPTAVMEPAVTTLI